MRSAPSVALLIVLAAEPSLAAAGFESPAPRQVRSETGDPLLDYKLRASRAETAHKEMRRAAKELVELSSAFADEVASRGELTGEDVKRLDKMRKLARRVRSDLGGSGDVELADPPRTIGAAALALGERSEALSVQMGKASRFEMNARLISLTGEIISLIDLLKRFRP